jgi:uncharacterized membrane protein YbaN (DUF454 family)
MRGFIQYIALVVVAVLAILVGIVGLVLPILPGLLLIAVGIVLLSMLNPKMETWLHSVTVKYPPVHKVVQDMQKFIGRIIGRK